MGNIGALQKYSEFHDGNDGKRKTVFHHVKDQIDCLWAKFQNTCDQEKKVISLLN